MNGAFGPTKNDFPELLARLHDSLGSWSTDTLSIAGRVVLIQSVLQALLLHLMSNAIVSIAVLEEIETICRKFLWA